MTVPNKLSRHTSTSKLEEIHSDHIKIVGELDHESASENQVSNVKESQESTSSSSTGYQASSMSSNMSSSSMSSSSVQSSSASSSMMSQQTRSEQTVSSQSQESCMIQSSSSQRSHQTTSNETIVSGTSFVSKIIIDVRKKSIASSNFFLLIHMTNVCYIRATDWEHCKFQNHNLIFLQSSRSQVQHQQWSEQVSPRVWRC